MYFLFGLTRKIEYGSVSSPVFNKTTTQNSEHQSFQAFSDFKNNWETVQIPPGINLCSGKKQHVYFEMLMNFELELVKRFFDLWPMSSTTYKYHLRLEICTFSYDAGLVLLLKSLEYYKWMILIASEFLPVPKYRLRSAKIWKLKKYEHRQSTWTKT